MHLILIASALALQSPPATPAPVSGPSARPLVIERMQWAKDVDGADPVTAIEVRNDFGDIRARLAPDRRLEATMVIQRLDAAGDKVGFTVERRGGSLALVVTYPPGRVRDSDPRPAKDSYDRLDLVVFVPPGVALRAHTLRGQVEARGLKSDVEAATQDGPVLVVRNTGAVQARTDTGEVTVQLEAGALAAGGPPHLLQTGTGAVTVLLPLQADPEVHIETAGEWVSNLGVTTTRHQGRTRAASPARAGRLLMISSRTGRVRVERDE